MKIIRDEVPDNKDNIYSGDRHFSFSFSRKTLQGVVKNPAAALTGLRHKEIEHTEIIKGSGHSMFGERPAESIGVVREYLNKYREEVRSLP